ncbi:mycothiol synthase [Sanguibacter sp. HDW7]|uniref:mycothiol synthase n=1 Tax=Sanguibacter sp. HDW7 TaxID=2714931 RepID=UPI0014076B7C|nr:mycothiol synthase [Sanguibacter sp. HDW7]QIK84469.1 mycothiol synthase [Sanguibacter sp. HDW7]
MGSNLTVRGPLDTDVAAEVRALAAAAALADGVPPISEQPLLNLTADHHDVVHVLHHDDAGALVAYAQLDPAGDPPTAELAVSPDARRQGLGTSILGALRDLAPGGFGLWAYGHGTGAQAFAEHHGLETLRELFVMDRPVTGLAARPTPPEGYSVRTFTPEDADAWVELNARSFAHHPEQGRLTRADLDARIAEPWFRADDLLLVDGPDGLAAFVWTKVVGADGELYVVAVDPGHQGRGLGHLLTETALVHLAERGCTRALLYVDGDNLRAVNVYRRAGFDLADRHVLVRGTPATR